MRRRPLGQAPGRPGCKAGVRLCARAQAIVHGRAEPLVFSQKPLSQLSTLAIVAQFPVVCQLRTFVLSHSSCRRAARIRGHPSTSPAASPWVSRIFCNPEAISCFLGGGSPPTLHPALPDGEWGAHLAPTARGMSPEQRSGTPIDLNRWVSRIRCPGFDGCPGFRATFRRARQAAGRNAKNGQGNLQSNRGHNFTAPAGRLQ